MITIHSNDSGVKKEKEEKNFIFKKRLKSSKTKEIRKVRFEYCNKCFALFVSKEFYFQKGPEIN